MTLQELLLLIDGHPVPVLAYFLALPVLAWIAGRLHTRSTLYDSPVRWLYTAVVYAACVPGIVAAVAVAEDLWHGRFLQLGLLSELLPFVAMLVTLGIVRNQANPGDIPGFRRMTGFMLLLLLTAAGVFLFMQTRIWIFIGGGLGTLLIAMAVLFLLLKWAFDRTFGPSR
jgi:hypothetical protein